MKKIILILALMGSVLAFAEDEANFNDYVRPDNPFNEGVERRRLTEDEKAVLLQYADTSKTRLMNAVADAVGKSVDEASGIYLGAIRKTVINSYKLHPRTELLMRYALNQALELTYGIPNETGEGLVTEGLLKNSFNKELLRVILEQSIQIALDYYATDREAIQSGNLTDLPFVDFAFERLKHSKIWAAGVLETYYQYLFTKVVIGQWLSTVMNSDELHKAKYAEEITRIDEVIKEQLENADTLTPASMLKENRKLRDEVKKLLKKYEEKKGAK